MKAGAWVSRTTPACMRFHLYNGKFSRVTKRVMQLQRVVVIWVMRTVLDACETLWHPDDNTYC